MRDKLRAERPGDGGAKGNVKRPFESAYGRHDDAGAASTQDYSSTTYDTRRRHPNPFIDTFE